MDRWFERAIPTWLGRWITLSGAIVCAALAGAYAEAAGFTATGFWGVIALGGFVGLLVLPLFIIAIKLVLLGLVLTVMGGVAWGVYVLITGP